MKQGRGDGRRSAGEAERWEEERQAVEKSVKDYVDQRLGNLPLPVSAGATRGGSVVGGEGWFWRYRPEIYLAVALIAIGLVAWSLRSPVGRPADPAAVEEEAPEAAGGATSSEAEAVEPVTPPLAEPSPLATPPAALDDPSQAWVDLVQEDPGRFAGWLAAVGEARGLEADQVSDRQKARFAGMAARLRESGKLGASDLATALPGLFEYVYGLYRKQEKGSSGEGFRVTLDFGGYEQDTLARLVAAMGLERWFTGRLDGRNRRLRVAVLSEWIRRRPLPEGRG